MKGKEKVRDKRLENGIGDTHACHDFKGGQICEGWRQGRVEGSLTLDPLCRCILCLGKSV